MKFSPCLHGTCSGKFAASALDEGDLLALHTGHFTPWKRVRYTLNVRLSRPKGLIIRLLQCSLTRLILLKFSVTIFFIMYIIYHVSITSLPSSNTSCSEITAQTPYAIVLVCMTANTSMLFFTNLEKELIYLVIYFPSRNISYKMPCLYEIRLYMS